MLEAAAVTEHAARLERDGYTIIPGLLDSPRVEEIRAEVDRLEAKLRIEPADNIFEGLKTRRVYNLLAHGKCFERLVDDDTLIAVGERCLDKGLLVSTISSIAIEPGEVAQPMHADDQLIPIARPHPMFRFSAIVAIDDFTAENGGTVVVPGSHRRPGYPQPWGEEGGVPTVMKKGDVLLYDGALWHGGGANTSNARRLAIAIGYVPGYMRQQENQQLGIPREIAKGFSPRLRKLVGYGLYKRLLGHIDKCSPVDLLDETGPRVVVGKMD